MNKLLHFYGKKPSPIVFGQCLFCINFLSITEIKIIQRKIAETLAQLTLLKNIYLHFEDVQCNNSKIPILNVK